METNECFGRLCRAEQRKERNKIPLPLPPSPCCYLPGLETDIIAHVLRIMQGPCPGK
jgi:hypothetical protein